MKLDIKLDGDAHRETIRGLQIAFFGALLGGVLIGMGDSLLSGVTLIGILLGWGAGYFGLAYLPSAERVAIEWQEREELYDGGER
jgi:hypothetical protein